MYLHFDGTCTPAELEEGVGCALRHAKRKWYVFGVLSALAFAGLDWQYSGDYTLTALGLLPLLFYLIWWEAYLPRQAARRLAASAAARAACVVTIDDDGFGEWRPGSETRRTWAEFASWREGRRVFCLRRRDGGFDIVPKRRLTPDEQTELRVFLVGCLGRYSR